MLPRYHIITGIIFSIIIYFLFSINILQAFLIFFGAVFIDVDHYLWFIVKKKNFNLKKAFLWFIQKRKIYLSLSNIERKNYKKTLLIFHGIEALSLVLILSYINKLFLFIFIGMILHLIFDYIEYIYIKEPFYSKFSQVMVYFRNKNKKELSI
ncbi:MAG: hypothetical protein QXW97_00485 [Candidatus Pacearchaeota archaeon]